MNASASDRFHPFSFCLNDYAIFRIKSKAAAILIQSLYISLRMYHAARGKTNAFSQRGPSSVKA